MLVLLASVAWACAGQTTTIDVQRDVESALYAFVQLDDAGLDTKRRQAIDDVRCLGEVIHAPHAASFLRLEAVMAFSQGNPPFAVGAFRSALTIQPHHQLQAAIAPPGGPLDGVYKEARTAPADTWVLPPSGGTRFVNGIQSEAVPAGLAVVQVTENTGRLVWTGIVTSPNDLPTEFGALVAPAPPAKPMPAPPAKPMPSLEPTPLPQPMADPAPTSLPPEPEPLPAPLAPIPQPLPPVAALPDEATGRNKLKLPLLIGAAVVGVAAAGLYTGAILQRGRYEAAPTAKRRQSTNLLFWGAVGVGTTAGVVGGIALALPSKTHKNHKKRDSDTIEGLY